MASEAGDALSKSLMQRLAALEGVSPRDAKAAIAQDLAAKSRREVTRVYFGLGLAASGVLGCMALLPLLFAHPGAARQATASELAQRQAAPVDEVPAAAEPRSMTGSLDLPIARSERASAPLPLRVTGVDAAEAVSVTLRDLPVSALLSSGERQDEHTWSLQLSDLENLRLTLGDGTPDIFDMTIEVASSSGARPARSVARVRLLDAPELASSDRAGSQQRQMMAARAVDMPFRTETVPAPRPQAAPPVVAAAAAPQVAVAEPPARLVRPDGMSALGALPREPAEEGRQVWWKMPPPSWSPFEPRADRR